jgi:hypothetical protein
MIVEQINNSTGTVTHLHHDQADSTRLLTGSTGTGKYSTRLLTGSSRKGKGKCSYTDHRTIVKLSARVALRPAVFVAVISTV